MVRRHCRSALIVSTAFALAACAHPAAPPPAAPSLMSIDGAHTELAGLTARATYTVLVFVSSGCPCVAAHRDRLEEIAALYGPRGVQVVGIDSEAGMTRTRLSEESSDYKFPLLGDEGARLANMYGTEHAGHTVIIDRQGRVLYRGGIDSDKMTVHPDAELYLRNALDDLLAGKPVRRAEAKTLGCVLRKW